LAIFYSFIHFGDLYSASSKDYYSEALPPPVTDREGLQRDVTFGRVGYQEGPQLKGEIVPC